MSRYLEAKQRQTGMNFFEVVLFHGFHGEMFLYPKASKVKWNNLTSDLTHDLLQTPMFYFPFVIKVTPLLTLPHPLSHSLPPSCVISVGGTDSKQSQRAMRTIAVGGI